ncbi:hypothetical protein K490DRAFT_71683 [Saccharata proteae CBS 121410]|uniref:Prolyl 4-hydroxylase alpha subunit domain-containing protein n=1 Tax=Saccharata proteae CBS 121410 TaxID=1314787 RepID=A0A9P4HYW7_9PEZI|nr:hypothetical protein K490DRAFT_71683 [Saccharata proteae CBS 121410]
MAKIPVDFLSGPGPGVTISRIDFSQTGLSDYAGHYAVVLDNVLTRSECQNLIALAEAQTEPNGNWERAMINVGGGRQMLATEARNCGRIIWDSPEMVARIWRRIEGSVPELQRVEGKAWAHALGNGPVQRGDGWQLTSLNERMRFLKYEGGEYFRPHCDGVYATPDGSQRSLFTLHLYLNGTEEDRPLVGGATTFHSFRDRFMIQTAEPDEYNKKGRWGVDPKAGRVLLFQHRNLLHSGDDVVEGTKYTMRTDVMFEGTG